MKAKGAAKTALCVAAASDSRATSVTRSAAASVAISSGV
jgi:hypothetical protein